MKRRALAVGLAALAAGGCGWLAGLGVPGDAQTVGVEVFDVSREILERDLQPRLNTAMTRALIDLVDARLASPAEADLVVRGRILEYRRRRGVTNPNNQLRESAVFIAASSELVDRRSGRVLASARDRIWSGYVIEPDTSVRNEADARDRALRHVAETLILDLFSPVEPTLGNEAETRE